MRPLFLLLPLVTVMACGRGEPARVTPDAAPEADAAGDVQAAAPELTPEQLQAERQKARENQPEPTLNPEEPREKFQLVWVKGADAMKNAVDERHNLFLQMKQQSLKEQAHKDLFAANLKRVEDFGIPRDPAELEGAAAAVCEVVVKLRDGAKALSEGPNAELATLDVTIKALEKEQEAGKKVSQGRWDKLEADRKELSLPILASGFLLLAAGKILDEAFILAEWGPRRAQLALRDCLTKIHAEGGLASDLAEASLEKTLSRSKWYRELE